MPELRSRPPQQHAGATLIEVLVAFLIISFGMLALLALQNNAIQYNKTTEYRSLATMLAMDLAERMRANREQALGGAYDLAGSPSAPDAMPERVPCFSAATEEQPAVSCTSATLALQDTSEWQRLLFMNLPGGRAHVEVIRDEAKDVQATANIWVAWDAPGGGHDVVGDTDHNTKECASALQPDADDPSQPGASMPRCAYFNIAL